MVRLLNLSHFIVERSQVFNLRAAENNRSSAALFAAFYQKNLADRHVCSRLLNLVFFIFSLRTKTKSRSHQQSVLKCLLIYNIFVKGGGGGAKAPQPLPLRGACYCWLVGVSSWRSVLNEMHKQSNILFLK